MEVAHLTVLLVPFLLLLRPSEVMMDHGRQNVRRNEVLHRNKQQTNTPLTREERESERPIITSDDAAAIRQEIQILREYKEVNLKSYKAIGAFKGRSSVMVKKNINKHKFRRKREIWGDGYTSGRGSSNGPGNHEMDRRSLSPLLSVAGNRSENATSTYETNTTKSTAATTLTKLNVNISTTATTSKAGRAASTTASTSAPVLTTAGHSVIYVLCRDSWLSCRGRCMKGRDGGQTKELYLQCYCDEHCETFTDCCYDYYEHCKNNSAYRHRLGSAKRSNMSQIKSFQRDVWKCIPHSKSGPPGTRGIWMISDCPRNWTDRKTREKCKTKSLLSYNDNIPVIARDGTTYTNRFCSLCHGVSKAEVRYYEVNLSCAILPPNSHNSEETREFLSSYNCSYYWIPQIGDRRRYCYNDIIGNCPNRTSATLQDECANGPPGIVYSMKFNYHYITYKNVYCASCHRESFLVCGPPLKSISTSSESILLLGKPKPFTIIMNLGFSSEANVPAIRRQTKVSCPAGEVYDPHLEVCRTGIAHAPKQNGFDKFRVSVWLLNQTDMKATPAGTGHPIKPINKNNFLLGFFSSFITDKLFISNAEVNFEGKTYRVIFDFERKYSNKTGRDRRKADTQLSIDNLLDFRKPIKLVIHSHNFTIIKVTTRRLSCVLVETFLRHEYTVLTHAQSAVYINRTNEVIKRQDYYVTELQNTSVDTITVCRRRLSFICNGSYISLTLDEVTLLPNKTIMWNAKGKVYEKGHYDRQNQTIWICTNFSTNGTRDTVSAEQYNQPLVVITIIGMSLSVILLFVLLVTYCIFSELRTLPGINLMNLSLSLLVAQMLWLLGSGLTLESKSCTAISLVLHFMFLSSFVWMSIIAVDTWLAFTKNGISRTNSRSKHKRFLRSMAIGWLTPLTFCSICFALDQTNTVAIGYGGRKGCWIQNTSSNLYFFAVPIGVLLLINIVFFALTVKAIRETIKHSQLAAAQKKSKKNLAIYVRIAALMGFTWLFGFLSSVHWYLAYVFVISCTLQGVYIAVAFVFTKRIVRLYSALLNKTSSSSTGVPLTRQGTAINKELPSGSPSRVNVTGGVQNVCQDTMDTRL